ncbi:hypothetical protein MNV49_000453 [Pseudohyphozyma bogoriensis]|nr:hypothetical protein MNV49_000444 [Pseudohyphozyma bogoriensis]KAI5476081.1 hypothetical protein MNV49_000453 [Pseudohyphozyma bogoriensis]
MAFYGYPTSSPFGFAPSRSPFDDVYSYGEPDFSSYYSPSHHQQQRQAIAQRQALARKQQAMQQQRRRQEEAARRQHLEEAAYRRQLAQEEMYRRRNPLFGWGNPARYQSEDEEASDEGEGDGEEIEEQQPQPTPQRVHKSPSTAPPSPTPISSTSSSSTPPATSPAPHPTEEATSAPIEDDSDSVDTTFQSQVEAHNRRQEALSTLKSFTSHLDSLLSSYIPPATLSFQPNHTAKLAFSPTNAPFLALEDALISLLTKIDGVQSEGDVVVRKARKELVKRVEKELGRLDAKKAADWAKVSGEREEENDADSEESLSEGETDIGSNSSEETLLGDELVGDLHKVFW